MTMQRVPGFLDKIVHGLVDPTLEQQLKFENFVYDLCIFQLFLWQPYWLSLFFVNFKPHPCSYKEHLPTISPELALWKQFSINPLSSRSQDGPAKMLTCYTTWLYNMAALLVVT